MSAFRDDAEAASDYYNSLPTEQRKKLAPLLEDYRPMGLDEARRELAALHNKINDRQCEIRAGRTRLAKDRPT